MIGFTYSKLTLCTTEWLLLPRKHQHSLVAYSTQISMTTF